jgi:aminopeptidase N
MKPVFIGLFAATTVLAACNSAETPAKDEAVNKPITSKRPVSKDDKFTYANYDELQITHLDLNLDVNFEDKVLDGVATIDFERIKSGVDSFTLDTKDLTIRGVERLSKGKVQDDAEFVTGPDDDVLGSALIIPLHHDTDQIRISYKTSPEAEGLQWLSPEQTAGKEKPYLFSQAQAINARTIAPLQDTPAVRHTYSATLRVPEGLRPLMSASQGDQEPDGSYKFDMPQPIPSYLIAIAVGDIEFEAINETIGVYAEKYILDAAAEEFSETPQMEEANEALYGPYRWGRYDLIVLPPSFPYGGMENPRLSFLTPTLVAGDKSLTNVVAHELAHSWSGNLVTNASWIDAWLNEGFTSYVENRIMEDLYGERRAVMEQALDMQGLKRAISEAKRPELTRLKLPTDMAHPDEAFTLVSYLKGANFLFFLEDRFGREAFDPFLKKWFNENAFQSVTTEDFLTYLNNNLRSNYPDAVTDAEINAWVFEAGLPDSARNPQSDAFAQVDNASQAWFEGGNVDDLQSTAANWSTHEWLHFLNTLPALSDAQYAQLDKTFSLTGTQNAETAFAWYMQAIKGDYQPAYSELENFLMTVGRGKFIYRLYAALEENGKADWADHVYTAARAGYHPIAQRRIDAIIRATR